MYMFSGFNFEVINSFETNNKNLSPRSKENYQLISRLNESTCGHV